LAKGDLKVRLDGYKLKGSWALVRTRGWAGSSRGRRSPGEDDGRSWLLIKHRDEWAGDLDITGFAPLSVKSGGDFADILTSDLPAFWFSDREGHGPGLDASLAQIIEKVEKYQGRPIEAPATPAPAKRSARSSKTAGRRATTAKAATAPPKRATHSAGARPPSTRSPKNR
jgi:hypothetical protein